MQIIVSGILANYQILNPKAKNTLLILHGWQQNLALWQPIALGLTKNYKVILLDLPGFGQSSFPKKAVWDTYTYANFVADFIKKLNIKKLDLLGHSFGGKLAIILATSDLHVGHLILISPSGIETRTFMTKLRIRTFKLLKPFFIFLPRSFRKYFLSLFGSLDYLAAGELQPSFKKIVNQNISPDAAKINVPTLIIWGEKDTELSLKYAKILKGLINHSKLRIVWGSGHNPHLEKSERLIEILNDFL